jgi:hypothetical protein
MTPEPFKFFFSTKGIPKLLANFEAVQIDPAVD